METSASLKFSSLSHILDEANRRFEVLHSTIRKGCQCSTDRLSKTDPKVTHRIPDCCQMLHLLIRLRTLKQSDISKVHLTMKQQEHRKCSNKVLEKAQQSNETKVKLISLFKPPSLTVTGVSSVSVIPCPEGISESCKHKILKNRWIDKVFTKKNYRKIMESPSATNRCRKVLYKYMRNLLETSAFDFFWCSKLGFKAQESCQPTSKKQQIKYLSKNKVRGMESTTYFTWKRIWIEKRQTNGEQIRQAPVLVTCLKGLRRFHLRNAHSSP